jgi:hypothetical protein
MARELILNLNKNKSTFEYLKLIEKNFMDLKKDYS